MKKLCYSVFILFVTVLFNSCGGNPPTDEFSTPQPQPGQTTGTISGTAFSDGSANFAPKQYSPENENKDESIIEKLFSSKKKTAANVLDNAQVYVIDYDRISYGPATTDANGNFSISGLPVTKNNFIIKIIKGNLVLKQIVSGVVAGQNTNIGNINSATTALIYLLEKRIKEETGQNVNLGDTTVSIPTTVKTKIQNINISIEKTNFKNSIDADSSSQNPIYLVYATIVRINEKIKNNEIIQTYEDYIKNSNNPPVPIILSDSPAYSVKPADVDTGIKNVRIITGLTVSPSAPIVLQGNSVQFSVIATFTTGETMNVTDSAYYTRSLITKGIIFSTGLFTANGDTGVLSLIIKINGKATTVLITVLNPHEITSITITPFSNVTVLGSLTRQFSVAGVKRNGSSIDLTNSVIWNKSGTAGAISAAGLFTGSHNGGTASVYATYSGLTSNSVSITNTAASISSIAITPTSATVRIGSTQQFTATAVYNDSITENITTSATWISSNTTKGTINSSGLFTGVASGSTNVSVTKNSVSSNICAVTVNDRQLVSITISANTTAIVVGGTAQMTALGTYDDQSTAILTSQVIWTSSDSIIATINSSGLVTGVDSGLTSISARYNLITSNIVNIGIIDNIAPTIVHTKVANCTSGIAVSINATITDNISVTSAKLWYRNGMVDSFKSVNMHVTLNL